MQEIVITGWALNSPLGNSIDTNMKALYSKSPNFTKITTYDISESSVKYAGQCSFINTSVLKDKKIKKVLTRKDLLGVCTAIEAFNNASINKHDPYRIGIYVGASCSQMGDLSDYFMLVSECADLKTQSFDSKKFGEQIYDKINPIAVLKVLMNNTLAYSTIELDIKGQNYNFMEFEVSGAKALYEAIKSLHEDKIDIAVVGAVSSPLDPFVMIDAYLWNILIQDQNNIDKVYPKPYDAQRAGTIYSESSAFVVLETKTHALKRQAPILGKILDINYGVTNNSFFLDGAIYNNSTYDLDYDPLGIQKSIEGILNSSSIDLSNLGFILSSANGSIFLDQYEAQCIKRILETNNSLDIFVTSSKGCVGESLESSFLLNLIYAINMLKNKTVIPTMGLETLCEQAEGLRVCKTPISLNTTASSLALVTTSSLHGISYSAIVGL